LWWEENEREANLAPAEATATDWHRNEWQQVLEERNIFFSVSFITVEKQCKIHIFINFLNYFLCFVIN